VGGGRGWWILVYLRHGLQDRLVTMGSAVRLRYIGRVREVVKW
jgi:hypothetical protein